MGWPLQLPEKETQAKHDQQNWTLYTIIREIYIKPFYPPPGLYLRASDSPSDLFLAELAVIIPKDYALESSAFISSFFKKFIAKIIFMYYKEF